MSGIVLGLLFGILGSVVAVWMIEITALDTCRADNNVFECTYVPWKYIPAEVKQ